MLPLWAQLAARRWCFWGGSDHCAPYDTLWHQTNQLQLSDMMHHNPSDMLINTRLGEAVCEWVKASWDGLYGDWDGVKQWEIEGPMRSDRWREWKRPSFVSLSTSWEREQGGIYRSWDLKPRVLEKESKYCERCKETYSERERRGLGERHGVEILEEGLKGARKQRCERYGMSRHLMSSLSADTYTHTSTAWLISPTFPGSDIFLCLLSASVCKWFSFTVLSLWVHRWINEGMQGPSLCFI